MSKQIAHYTPHDIERTWQEIWEKEKVFSSREEVGETTEKFYLLVMFPYPSGRIHMGHVRNYAIGDLMARHQRLTGKNVLHPMGWDAFGMPAENAAIQSGEHPKIWTSRNIDTMRADLKRLGFSYDWDRTFATCDPDYAHWEQALFLKLHQQGLVYRKESLVNWDPVDHTVLANEQVIDGKGWRSGAPVEKKPLNQWFLKITHYADELLESLRGMPGWPDAVKTMQNHWIGKSHGVEFSFEIQGYPCEERLTVYTTRPDTLMGVTFCSLAIDHPLAHSAAEKQTDVADFIRTCQQRGTREEELERQEKLGVDTGLRAIHPFTGEALPIFVANFVVMSYGTGAVMAVPAHDQRDFEFAKKYNLPIKTVIQPDNIPIGNQQERLSEAYTGSGRLIHSGPFNGLDNTTAKQRIGEALVEKKIGRITVNYRLRDWGISRQRYWGNPIPFVHCAACGVVPVPENDLPVTLPEQINFSAQGNPLDSHPTWKQTQCPQCNGHAQRETDTMDTFMESSWYFLRYCCPDHTTDILDKKRVNYWMPVDHYIGGIEHAVLHLLYARFFHKALRDINMVSCDEPFTRLLTQGMVRKDTHRCQEHGWRHPSGVTMRENRLLCSECQRPIVVGRNEKMSKSKNNVIDPGEIIQKYGADTARLFILFAAPPEKDLAWSDSGVEGAWRFLNRLWRFVNDVAEQTSAHPLNPTCGESPTPPTMKAMKVEKRDFHGKKADALQEQPDLKRLRHTTHRTIMRVTEDIDRLQFNTGISAVMELINEGVKYLGSMSEISEISESDPLRRDTAHTLREMAETALLLLNPYVPHITEALWRRLGNSEMIARQQWPKADPNALVRETITLVVQINGKLRDRLNVAPDLSREALEIAAQAAPGVRNYLADKRQTVHKIVIVPNRLINLVTKP